MMKIEKLTPEQEALIPEFREEWRKIGLNTKSIDRPQAEESIKNLYKAAGESEPTVLFFDSPMACQLAINIFKSLNVNLGGQLKDQLRDQLWDQLRGQLRDQLIDQLRDQLWDQLVGHLGGQLKGHLGGQLRDQLIDQLRDQLWDKRIEVTPLYFSGGWDSYWICFYLFAAKMGVKYKNQNHLDAYINYVKNCGGMHAFKNIVFCSDRALKLNFDDRKLLHCEDGYAIKFRDGYGFCAWHGVRVPEEWIIDKKLDAKTAITWDNMEQRRAACEIIGWNNILAELNAVTIDKNENPFVGELLEVDLPDVGKEKFLRVKCGTSREFALPVPPEMQRASQAQAWLNFTTEDMYLPKVRT